MERLKKWTGIEEERQRNGEAKKVDRWSSGEAEKRRSVLCVHPALNLNNFLHS